MTDNDDNWRSNGVRIVRQEQFDPNPARWTGVQLDGAITFAIYPCPENLGWSYPHRARC